LQASELFFGFDTLCNNPQAQTPGNLDDGSDDGAIDWVLQSSTDEGLVYLDCVDGEVLYVV
jgi:hypothetical protein